MVHYILRIIIIINILLYCKINIGTLILHVHALLGQTALTNSLLGFCKLCQHNFEHYRQILAFKNNASIIGIFSKNYWPNFTSVHKFKPKRQFLPSTSDIEYFRLPKQLVTDSQMPTLANTTGPQARAKMSYDPNYK